VHEEHNERGNDGMIVSSTEATCQKDRNKLN